MFRIGFDAKRLFNNFTGLGNYSRTLAHNLSEQYPDHHYYLYTPKIQKLPQTSYFLNSPDFSTRLPRFQPAAFWRSYGLKKQLQKDQVQLFHGLSNELPLGLRSSGIKSVVTIHDLIFRHHPDWYPLIDRKIYEGKFRYSCTKADQIIAISESTKQDIIRFYGVESSRISVVYQSCGAEFIQQRSDQSLIKMKVEYQLPDQYLLYVGAITERKNLLGVLKALLLLPKEMQLPLVVVGKGKTYLRKVKKFVAENKLEKQLIFLPRLRQEDLPALYQAASVFLYPSHYEGFGIPIIEALYSGTPVLTSGTSSLPEAGGPGAHYIDPSDPAEIADGIEKLLSDSSYRKQLIEKGRAYVQRFDPAVSTKAVMDLYEKCLEG